MTTYSILGWGLFAAGCLIAVAFICWLAYLAIGRDNKNAQHTSGEHHWPTFQAPVVPDQLDKLVASYVPAPVSASPLLAGAGTSTRVHAIEVHPVQHWAAAAWERITPAQTGNQRMGYWTAREDFTESAWTKRSATELAIALAKAETDAGFASIKPREICEYAFSGILPRWEGAA